MRSTSIRRSALLGVGVLTAVTLIGTPVDAAPAESAAPVTDAASMEAQVDAVPPELRWHGCVGGTGRFQCTRADVPLDYDHPSGPTTSIAILRLPANEPEHRIGSLFVNPGGPGASATDLVGTFARALGPDVTARFDIVGIDPRGVGRSTPLRCVDHRRERDYNPLPFTARQARPLIRAKRQLAAACARHSNQILDHMTTADTARDMDLIRQAMGDDQLTYYGVSYGTYLGATYAAMFPDRVRAVVLDGVLDPVAFSTGRPGYGHRLPFTTRIGSGTGSWEALTSAFAECDRVGKSRCRLAGEAADKWRRLTRVFKRGPVEIAGIPFDYASLISATTSSLYTRDGYAYLMHQISLLYRLAVERPARERSTSGAAKLADWIDRSARRQPAPYASGLRAWQGPAAKLSQPAKKTYYPAFDAVGCSDSVNPHNARKWVHAGAVADRQGPWFGRAWTWQSVACAFWPADGADAYRGPWRTTTSSPLLLIGNAHDPATPIRGARATNRLFTGSQLITLDAWGHGALGQSDCVKERSTRYLLHQRLPAPGLVCQPDKDLFPRRG